MDKDIETLDVTGSSPGQSDATPGSSAPNDDNGADSSSEQGAKKPTLSEALDKVQLEEPEEESGEVEQSASEQAEESPTTEQDAEAGEAAADEATEGKDEKSGAEGKADGSLNQGSWDKTPEWSGLLKLTPPEKRGEVIKAIRPIFERAHKAEEAVKRLKPAVDLVNEFRHYAGDEQGFEQMRHIIRQYATDPAASVPVLEGMLQDARQRAGLVVTSDDLKARLDEIDAQVAAGELSETVAEKWKADIAATEQSRAGTRQAATKLQAHETTQQRQAAQAMVQARAKALNDWEARIQQTEPSFGEITDVTDPNHGKSLADDVFDGVTLFMTRVPNATPAQLVGEAERVLKLAKAKRGQAIRQQRVITSEGSSINAKRKPRTVMEAMNNVKLVG